MPETAIVRYSKLEIRLIRFQGDRVRQIIEVIYLKGNDDVIGKYLTREILEFGYSIQRVSTSQLYECKGSLSSRAIRRLERELLTDQVTQACHLRSIRNLGKSWVADVWFKPGVTDVVAESVRLAALDMDIHGLQQVRTGSRYYLRGGLTRPEAMQSIHALVANSVIHEVQLRRYL